MELEKNNKPQEKVDVKTIVYGLGCVLFVIVSAFLVLRFEESKLYIQTNWKEIGKGILIGFSSLPLMLFIAFRFQAKKNATRRARAATHDPARIKNTQLKIANNSTSVDTRIISISIILASILSAAYSTWFLYNFMNAQKNALAGYFASQGYSVFVVVIVLGTAGMIASYFIRNNILILASAILFTIAIPLKTNDMIVFLLIAALGYFSLYKNYNLKTKNDL